MGEPCHGERLSGSVSSGSSFSDRTEAPALAGNPVICECRLAGIKAISASSARSVLRLLIINV
jgi:hypothetical protein